MGEWSDEQQTQLEADVDAEVRDAAKEAESYGTLLDGRLASSKSIFDDVFKEHAAAPPAPAARSWRADVPTMPMNVAIRSALDVMLDRDDDVVVFGEDVGYFGGVFRCTEGLQAKYGTNRVFDTPIAEGGIIGVAVGMGAYGLRPVAEIQFADYVYPGLDQLISEAARLRYRSGAEFTAPITVRMPARRRDPRRADAQPEPGEPVHPRVRVEDGHAVDARTTPRGCSSRPSRTTTP